MSNPGGTTSSDDSELIASAQRGDRQAFTELVCRHQSAVVGMLYRMYGDARLAEDAAQEAFVRVWQHLDGYRSEYSFRGWLYRIAANAALDALRREHPGPDLDSVTGADAGPGPELSAEADQRAARVRRAIASLTPPLRIVLVLREYQELSYREIAEALDVPLGTVMSRLSTARTQLRRELLDLMEET